MLTWLYNGTGGSIFACAVWHGLFNLGTGTTAADGTIQAVTSAFVYVQALLLVGLELRARRRGEASILGPRRSGAPASQASYLVDTVSSQPLSLFSERARATGAGGWLPARPADVVARHP